MENFILIILAMSIGYTINRLNIFSKDAPLILNQFLIYISLPAMILLQIPKLDISIEAIKSNLTTLLIFRISPKITEFWNLDYRRYTPLFLVKKYLNPNA